MRVHVEIDMSVFDHLRAAAASSGEREALTRAARDMVEQAPVFASERASIVSQLEDAFDFDAMLSPGFWDGQDAVVRFIRSSLGKGLDGLSSYLPRSIPGAQSLTVFFVPAFATNYGPMEGSQILALHPNADPEEAFHFLLHVCYHEVSSSFLSETSRIASSRPDTPDRFRHWLLLLVQNEGIANFAVLEDMLRLRELGRVSRYFTYAPLVGRPEATAQAMGFCRKTLVDLDAESVRFLRERVNAVLKNPKLPVIPLVGIHIANVVATVFGVPALVEVVRSEPQEFFAMYAESGDQLTEFLFGPESESIALFGFDGDRSKVVR